MHREHALDTLAVADAADRERLVETMPAATDHDAREDLDAFLVAFDDLRMHAHAVAHLEIQRFLAVLFLFNFVQQYVKYGLLKAG